MCHEWKPETDFAFRSIATGKREDQCRVCHAAYRRAHYERTKPRYIENERLRVRGHRERNRQAVLAFLLAHPCVDCGESDPVVLEFDHRDPRTKRLEVARLATRKPWPVVLAEIAKCDVRCASCHRKRTAIQFRWRRWSMTAHSGAPGELAAALALPIAAPAVPSDTSDVRSCSTCGRQQPITEFALKNPRRGTRNTKCKSCQRRYSKEHYLLHRDTYLAKARRQRVTGRDRFAAVLLDYFSEHPCIDCGAAEPVILEFDHRDGEAKIATINALMRSLNWAGLLTEIPKCDVRCANCHRRRTARQFGWSRLRLGGAPTAA